MLVFAAVVPASLAVLTLMTTSRFGSLAFLPALFAIACVKHDGVAELVIGDPPLFETRVEIETGPILNLHSDYVVADLNNDTVLDMAVISLNGKLKVLLGNRTNFDLGQVEQEIGGVPAWMSSGDFDGDLDLDLVIVRSAADTTELWLNDGLGGFAKGGTLLAGADALAIAVGDLDQDDDLDVAITRPAAPQIVVGYGDGAGGFASTQLISLPGGGSAFNVQIGDADRDTNVDLVVVDPTASRLVVFRGEGPGVDGSFGEIWFQLLVPGTAGAVAFGDLSGDALPDMVVSAFNANKYVVITELLGPLKDGILNGQTYAYASFDIPVPAKPSLATVGDVTGDGLGDLVACLAFNATMCIAPQLPGGGVGPQFQLDTSGLPLRPFVGDFDQNGSNDLFALSGLGDRINMWLAKETGVLAGARNYATGLPGASWIEGGDLDGDGDFEVLTSDTSTTQLGLLGPGPAGGLVVETVIDVGFSVDQLECADLDNDGRLDVVVAVPGGIKLLRNLSTPGAYAFEVLPVTVTTLASGEFPFGIAVKDLDRDGDIDIAFCDYVGGGLHIVPGTATPFSFGPETEIQLGSGPVDVVAADFTGDGLPDLAVSRASASDIVVLRNQGGTFVPLPENVGVGNTPVYLVTADFNRDGRADLVVSNATSDTVTVLFGSANGLSGQSYPAGAAPTALLARDLTDDGIDDILVASLRSGDFRVMVGDGIGSFPLLPSFPGTLGASDAVLQDMDGDGRPDLLIASLITSRLSLVKNITE